MLRWIMYDIADDRARTAVARACKRAGLYRVQLSVFIGSLAPAEFDDLQLLIAELIDADKDKAYLFTMTQRELKKTVLLGQAFDKKLVSDEVSALFI